MSGNAGTRLAETPFRFSLRTYTPEEIAALNAELRREGDAAFRPAEDLLRDIERGVTPSRALAPTWHYHPDERVQLALLERQDLTPVSTSIDQEPVLNIGAIWATAYMQAASEGVVWTPVLDYLSGERYYWPPMHVGSELVARGFDGYVPRRLWSMYTYRDQQQQVALLFDWIRSGTPERVHQLLRFRSAAFIAHVLPDMPALEPATLRQILERRPGVGPKLALNVLRLSKPLQKTLKDWAFDDLPLIAERLRALPPDAPVRQKIRATDSVTTLLFLLYEEREQGMRKLRPDEVDRLLLLLEVKDDPEADFLNTVRRILLSCAACLDEDRLLKLLSHLSPNSNDVVTLVERAEQATPRVWRACLEHSSTDRVYAAVSRQEDALRVPEIRTLLEQGDSIDALTALWQDSTGEEFRRVFRKLARIQPGAAATLLEQNPKRARFLERSDLVPLLESANAADRLLAIALVGDIVAGTGPADERLRESPTGESRRLA